VGIFISVCAIDYVIFNFRPSVRAIALGHCHAEARRTEKPRVAAATTRSNEIVAGTMPSVLPFEDLTHPHQFFGKLSASRQETFSLSRIRWALWSKVSQRPFKSLASAA
jgi:hypothetical protein